MAVSGGTLSRIESEKIEMVGTKRTRVVSFVFTSDGSDQSIPITDATNGSLLDVTGLSRIERIEVVEMPHETTTPTATDILRAQADAAALILYLGAAGTNTKNYTCLLRAVGL